MSFKKIMFMTVLISIGLSCCGKINKDDSTISSNGSGLDPRNFPKIAEFASADIRPRIVTLQSANGSVIIGQSATSQIFRYDPQTGKCTNSSGAIGLNEITIEQIYRTKDGECSNLKAKCLVPKRLLSNGDSAQCMPKQNTSIAKEINFRGADLRDSRLAGYFGLIGCKLEGANLSTLDFHGYATIQGSANSFTKLPRPPFTKAECYLANGQVSCVSHQTE